MKETIFAIIYGAWAVYSGLKFIKKKGWFADAEGGFNSLYIRKMVTAFLIGHVVGAFYFVIIILSLFGIVQRTW